VFHQIRVYLERVDLNRVGQFSAESEMRVFFSASGGSLPGGERCSANSRMDQIVQSYVANKQFMGTVLVARASNCPRCRLRSSSLARFKR